ncbi:MAG: helix-turn-helix transcriptional regulator [Candidatus Bathyarchaeia archaeon]|jgi:putative transcriptional regulator
MKNRLKVYRATQNMTQEELAEKAHVTRQTIISIESGKYEPSIQLAFKLSKIFNVHIEDIFIYEE